MRACALVDTLRLLGQHQEEANAAAAGNNGDDAGEGGGDASGGAQQGGEAGVQDGAATDGEVAWMKDESAAGRVQARPRLESARFQKFTN